MDQSWRDKNLLSEVAAPSAKIRTEYPGAKDRIAIYKLGDPNKKGSFARCGRRSFLW